MLDDDFFEIDENFLSSIDVDNLIETAESQENKIPRCLRYFNCTGEDQLHKLTFDEQSFIANNELKLIGSTSKAYYKQELFGLDLSEDVLTDPQLLQNLLAKARMNAQAMIVLSFKNNSIVMKQRCFKMRQQNTTFLFQLRHLLFTDRIKYETAETLLRPFHLYLEQINALPIVDALHALFSIDGNETTSAAYHLLHGHLEWRWLALTIYFYNERVKSNSHVIISTMDESISKTDFEEKLLLFIYDLIVISIAKFNKLHVIDIPTKTPFVCGCVKEVWLLLQLLVEQYNTDGLQSHSFWSYFNKALNWHRELKNPYAMRSMGRLSIKRETIDIHPNDYTLFSFWLLNGVASLNGFTEDGHFQGNCNPRVRENTELLENLLKSFIATEPNEQNFRITLLVVNSLLNNWWTQKPELIMHFWEYFHKRLNSSFFLNSADPASLAVVGKTAAEYLEQVQKLIETENITTNMSSYSIFLNSLGKVIQRLQQNDSTNAVMKIIGRIFTKFGESKLNALSEIGIHNLQTLLFVLASTFSNQQIDQRLQSTLLQIRLERLPVSRQVILMKGHVALILLQEKRDINVQSYLGKILDQVNKLNSDENKLPVLRVLIEILEKMCTKDNLFSVGTYMIIDSWIFEFLSLSSQAEQERCLQCIGKLLNFIGHHYLLKTRHPQEHAKVKVFLFKSILPHIKQIYRHSNVFNGVPDTAATFSLNATGENGIPIFSDLFKFFTEAVVCDIQIIIKYLVRVISTDYIYRVEQVTLVRLWLKCSILSTTQNEDIRKLTKLILKLMEFRKLCSSSEMDLMQSKEPLSVFFATCGKMYNDANDEGKKTLTELLRLALDGFETWIPISDSPPAIFKIHITLALVIFHCAPMVYVRSKPSCFFSVIMNHYILPLPLLVGKTQKMISIQAVHKVWHLIVGGIETLDYQSDGQLQKVFTDLIVKWIPHFRLLQMQKIIPKPFISVAQNCKEPTLQFVLEKMVSNFISSQRRETHQNAPITVSIIKEMLCDVSNQTEKVRVLLNATILPFFEHAMMVDEHLPSRNLVFEFLDTLLKTAAYISTAEIRSIVISNLKILTTKNLSYYSSFYFQFMTELTKHNGTWVVEIMPHLREQVEHVEKLRGAGPDAKLRTSLRQLYDSLDRIE